MVPTLFLFDNTACSTNQFPRSLRGGTSATAALASTASLLEAASMLLAALPGLVGALAPAGRRPRCNRFRFRIVRKRRCRFGFGRFGRLGTRLAIGRGILGQAAVFVLLARAAGAAIVAAGTAGWVLGHGSPFAWHNPTMESHRCDSLESRNCRGPVSSIGCPTASRCARVGRQPSDPRRDGNLAGAVVCRRLIYAFRFGTVTTAAPSRAAS